MEKLNMFYREIAPSADLASYVLSFWEFSVATDAPSIESHEIFPDGCVSLFYYHNLIRGVYSIGVSGSQIETIRKPVAPGDTFWGCRISPAACADLLKVDARQMLGRGPSGNGEFLHLYGEIFEKLKAVNTFEDAVAIFEDRLRELKPLAGEPDPKVVDAIRLIEDSSGSLPVAEIAKLLGLSTRHFQRRFKAKSGLTPKQYIRTRRIRATAVDLVREPVRSWADKAAELGFADQSHLTHEFVAITKRSPNSFAKKVRDIEHGDLVE